MKLDQDILFQFYQNLGKLFYAIAAIDKTVRAEEFETLQKLVNKYWINQDIVANNSKKDLGNVITDTFKWLSEDDEYSAEDCYNSFIRFKKQNESIFNSKMNTLILKTAGKIATSFSNQNKSELIMLAKLNIELKKSYI